MTEDTDDALDRPIRDLLGVYDPSLTDDPLSLVEVHYLFGQIHPADAGRIVRDVSMGVGKWGFTAQGCRHPDFQNRIRALQKEPYARDGSAPSGVLKDACEWCAAEQEDGLNEPFPVHVPGVKNGHSDHLELCDRCCLAARVLAYTRPEPPFVDVGLYQEVTFYARQLAAIEMGGDPSEAVVTDG